MKYSSVVSGVLMVSMAFLAAVAVLSVNDAKSATDAYLKVGEINGEARGSEKANDIAGETSTSMEQTRFARERIGEIADKLGGNEDQGN